MSNDTYINPIHLAQVIAALRIEVRTGMKMSRGSVLKLVQQVYGVRSRTKAGALEELLALKAQVDEALGLVKN